MKKFLLLCTVVFTTRLTITSCKKTYTVEEFKKDDELRNKWGMNCFVYNKADQSSQNCQNALKAKQEIDKPVSTRRGVGF
ncbi:EexN family lipoprotein [Bartonella schoenbuchensis]|uniref:EexN family lipoprotein n=1 Tax=Bartonella schoenbuchensis TaxID=165694 RepID=UPI003144ED95